MSGGPLNATMRLDRRRAIVPAIAAAILALSACGGSETSNGKVRFALTDAPACGFDEVNVTIERIRVHRNADAGESASGWTDHRLNPARRIDLLKLGNGVLEELGELSIAAGRYAQMRLVLAANGSGTPANSVLPSGGSETALDITAAQGGIAVAHAFSVTEDKTTDVLFDFDACRSVAASGSSNFVLRPVVKVAPRNGATIAGYVDAALAGVSVSAQKAGVPARETVADANGRFVLAFLDPANSPYDVVFAASGRATAVVSAVRVTSTSGAELSRMEAPITLPVADDRAASGTVGPEAARGSAAVRALQVVGSAGPVEVRTVRVNAVTGGYRLDLPAAQPRLAAFSTRLPLNFSGAGTAGLYELEADADGYSAQTQAVDVRTSTASWSPTLLRQ